MHPKYWTIILKALKEIGSLCSKLADDHVCSAELHIEYDGYWEVFVAYLYDRHDSPNFYSHESNYIEDLLDDLLSEVASLREEVNQSND